MAGVEFGKIAKRWGDFIVQCAMGDMVGTRFDAARSELFGPVTDAGIPK
jgi:hypothetical protein